MKCSFYTVLFIYLVETPQCLMNKGIKQVTLKFFHV